MAQGNALNLLAEDAEDLQILSAAVQDGVARLADMSFDRKARRFLIALNRFRWETDSQGRRTRHERARSALAVDGVLAVRVRGLPAGDREMIVSLLSISFEPAAEPPGGVVKLLFAGDGEIALSVECIDATLSDLGPVWTTRSRPDHDRKREE